MKFMSDMLGLPLTRHSFPMGGYFGDSGLSCFFPALFKPPPAFPTPRRYVVVWACEKARSINCSHVSSCFLSSVMNNRHENPAYLVTISIRAWVRPVAIIHVSTVLVNDVTTELSWSDQGPLVRRYT